MSLFLELTSIDSLYTPIKNKQIKKIKTQKTWNPDDAIQQQIEKSLPSINDNFEDEKKKISIKKPKIQCSWISKFMYFFPQVLIAIVVFYFIDDLRTQLSELKTCISSMNIDRINYLSQKNTSDLLSTRFNELENSNEELKKEIAILQKNYESVTILLSNIQKSNDLHTSNISQIQQDEKTPKNELSQLKSSNDLQNQQIANIKNNAETQTKQISQLMQRIESLNLSLSKNSFDLPLGTILAFSGSYENFTTNNDSIWIPCDGRVLLRDEYPELFDMIGTTYGDGDGIYTFNLPDLRGRTIVGSGQGDSLTARKAGDKGGVESVVLNIEQMPKHFHQQSGGVEGDRFMGGTCRKGKFRTSDNVDICYGANTSPVGGSQPHENMQPFLVTNFLVKVK